MDEGIEKYLHIYEQNNLGQNNLSDSRKYKL